MSSDNDWRWFWQLVAAGVFAGLWIVAVAYALVQIGCVP